MAASQRGLGKGLDALLQGSSEKTEERDIKHLPVKQIIPNRFQPRRNFSDESLQELAHSIRSQGVLQPILVRSCKQDSQGHNTESPQYELVAGERRLRAAKLCGLRSIPAIVREMSDDDSLILAMIENLQREDLNPIDEAAGLASLQQRMKASQDDLARAVGKSRPAVANALRLLQLPESVQHDVSNGALSAGHARTLLGIEDPELLKLAHQQIVSQQLSVRQAEKLAAYIREHGQLPDDAAMPPVSGGARQSRKTAHASPEFVQLQEDLSQQLSLSVSLQGTPDKGKLVLAYASQEQFNDLLARLGVEA